MPRKRQHPSETAWFKYENVTPKDTISGDCAVRAAAGATGKTWVQTVRELTEIGIKHCVLLNDEKAYGRFLEQNGFARAKQPRKPDGSKYTIKEYCEYLNEDGNAGKDRTEYVIHTSRHLTRISWDEPSGRYKIKDTWDCGRRIVGKMWEKHV